MKKNGLTTLPLFGWRFSFKNWKEFGYLYKDIFLVQEYNIPLSSSQPLIIDCGSHIGISVLFFKKKYPLAHVIAFEPNPDSALLLEENVKQNKLQEVTIVQKAILDKKGKTPFYINDLTKNPWTWGNTAENTILEMKGMIEITVESTTLKPYLTKPVDLLKLDIEGSEEKVLRGIEPYLSQIKNMIIEYHGRKTLPHNRLEVILGILEAHHFSYEIKQGTRFRKSVCLENLDRTDPYFALVYASRKPEHSITPK